MPRNRHLFPDITIDFSSNATEKLDSNSLLHIKKSLLNAANEQDRLKRKIASIKEDISEADRKLERWEIFPFYNRVLGGQVSDLENNILEKEIELTKLQENLKRCSVNLKVGLDEHLESSYQRLEEAYIQLCKCSFVWDVTLSTSVDRYTTRSAASSAVERKEVKFEIGNVGFIDSKCSGFHLQNANGADLYLYPPFLLMLSTKSDFALIDLRDVAVSYSAHILIETERVPSDAKIVGQTWAKTNKDGSPDKRFTNNYQIPLVEYGKIYFESNKGLKELYSFSNAAKAENFSVAFQEFKFLVGKNYSSSQSNKEYRGGIELNAELSDALQKIGLGAGVTGEQIKVAYRDSVKKYHPDKVANLGDEFKVLAERKTKEINAAYELLKKNFASQDESSVAESQHNVDQDAAKIKADEEEQVEKLKEEEIHKRIQQEFESTRAARIKRAVRREIVAVVVIIIAVSSIAMSRNLTPKKSNEVTVDSTNLVIPAPLPVVKSLKAKKPLRKGNKLSESSSATEKKDTQAVSEQNSTPPNISSVDSITRKKEELERILKALDDSIDIESRKLEKSNSQK